MRLMTSIFALLASPAIAAPNVLTDIAPIHGLVSDVMGDVGTPTLLLPAGSDGHHYTMRPSDAKAISDADVIIRVGDALTPWLTEPLATLAVDTPALSLLETQGWTLRAVPEGIHEEEEGHDDHADHGKEADHDDHADHADHDKDADHADHDAHDHGGVDPHAWLDPRIAAIWVVEIAKTLSAADPENAPTYMANAASTAASFAALEADITATLAPTIAQKVMWPHAAYGYFEDRFGLTSVGAIAQSDASEPGPAHIAELRKVAVAGDVDCVLIDAEINDRWAQIMVEGTDIAVAKIDPVGIDIDLGQGFYTTLLTGLSTAIAGCQ